MTHAVLPLTEALLQQVLADSEAAFCGGHAAPRAAVALAMNAPADWRFVLTDRGWPMMAWGLWPLWPGRAEAWCLSVRHASTRDLAVGIEAARAMLWDGQATFADLHRVEMWVNAEAPWAVSFATRLGMTQEGRARAWGPDGSDHLLFARIAGDT